MYNHVKRSLNELLTEAINDECAIDCHGKGYFARLSLGVKIIIDLTTKEIKMFNTHLGGGFYKEIEPSELEFFMTHGWKLGCYEMALKNNRHKIDSTAIVLRQLSKSKRHEKLIEDMTKHRNDLIEMYNDVLKRKLNYINKFNLETNV